MFVPVSVFIFCNILTFKEYDRPFHAYCSKYYIFYHVLYIKKTKKTLEIEWFSDLDPLNLLPRHI